MAQMRYRIADEPHTAILSIRPDLPPYPAAIVNKSPAKQNEDRYGFPYIDGAEMAEALRQCIAGLRE